MPGLWDRIWQGSEYARVTQGSEYAIIWLNMSAYDVNMPEYVWIYDNRREHVSCSIQGDVTLQVHEYLLRDWHIQNPMITMEGFGKIII